MSFASNQFELGRMTRTLVQRRSSPDKPLNHWANVALITRHFPSAAILRHVHPKSSLVISAKEKWARSGETALWRTAVGDEWNACSRVVRVNGGTGWVSWEIAHLAHYFVMAYVRTAIRGQDGGWGRGQHRITERPFQNANVHASEENRRRFVHGLFLSLSDESREREKRKSCHPLPHLLPSQNLEEDTVRQRVQISRAVCSCWPFPTIKKVECMLYTFKYEYYNTFSLCAPDEGKCGTKSWKQTSETRRRGENVMMNTITFFYLSKVNFHLSLVGIGQIHKFKADGKLIRVKAFGIDWTL